MKTSHLSAFIFGTLLLPSTVNAQSPVAANGAQSTPSSADAQLQQQPSDMDQEIPFKIGGKVKPPKLISSPAPHHPLTNNSAKGHALVSFVVSSTGVPNRIHILSIEGEYPDSASKTLEAIKQYKFQPATKDNKPVAVAMTVEIYFSSFQN
jgi:Gram-negative bacterial TonB protein C-terminal